MSLMREVLELDTKVSKEDLDDKQTPMEAEPGYVRQPKVALYVPEDDGVLEQMKNFTLNGVAVYPVRWSTHPGLEAKEAIITQLLKAQQERSEDEQEEIEGYEDYSLYVISPRTEPYLYQNIYTPIKDNVGILLTDNLESYAPDMLSEMQERFGLERFHFSAESVETELKFRVKE